MHVYHYTFVHHSREYIDIERDYACVAVGSLWKVSVPSTQFSCEPKKAKRKTNLSFFIFTVPSIHLEDWGGEESKKGAEKVVSLNSTV